MSSAKQQNNQPVPATADPISARTTSGLLTDYLTPNELAVELDISPRTLKHWDNQRIGPPRVVIGRLVRYRREAVTEWLRTHEQNFEELKSDRSWRKTRHR